MAISYTQVLVRFMEHFRWMSVIDIWSTTLGVSIYLGLASGALSNFISYTNVIAA